MAMSVGIVSPFFIMLLLGGGAGLPVGLPPLPEDPLLARIAPAECLYYTCWSGMAKPNAASTNQTEQLLAEPEIQQMVREIERAILSGVDKNAPPHQAAMARDAIRWGKMLLTRPAAAYITSVVVKPNGPDVRGGVAVNAGDDAAELKAALEKYQAMLPHPAEKVEIGGVSCYRLSIAPDAPSITWGIKDKHLVVGIGDGSLEEMLKRADGTPPAWLAKVRKQLPVERVSTIGYFNVKKIVAQFAPLGGAKAQAIVDAAGLGNVTSLASVTGLDGEGFVNRTLLSIDGEPKGIFSLAAGKPLAPRTWLRYRATPISPSRAAWTSPSWWIPCSPRWPRSSRKRRRRSIGP